MEDERERKREHPNESLEIEISDIFFIRGR